MISKAVIANRYAVAFFQYVSQDRLVHVAGEFKLVQDIIRSEASLWSFLNTPLIPTTSKTKILSHVLEAIKPAEEIQIFLIVLLRKGRFFLLAEIYEKFYVLIQTHAHHASCLIRTAYELGPQLQKSLQERLEKLSGRVLDLQIKKDASLLGGLVVYLGEKVYDFSFRGRLRSLSRQLLENERGV